jgi:hypothetical protein
MFIKTMDSLIAHNDMNIFNKCVVINEYSPDASRLINEIIKKYPFIEFIQKDKNNIGQARSLNIIIDIIKANNYKYWVHWEESWVCTRQFINKAIDIMENSKITQLQFTPDWQDHKHKIILPDYHILLYDYDINETEKILSSDKWPLYSLRPSINRANFYADMPSFLEYPSLWPVIFERLYGNEWIKKGAIKGIIIPSVCQRTTDNYSSTYSK